MLAFNPFTLRKRLREYISKYAKQACVIVQLKGELAKHSKENDRLLQDNHQLRKLVKEKDEQLIQIHTTLTNNLNLARTIEFGSLPRNVKREILRGKK